MVRVILLAEIKRSKNTTRYLVKEDNGNYASILFDSKGYYEIGNVIDVDESKLNDRDYNSKWESKISSWNNKKAKIINHLIDFKLKVLKISDEGFWESSDGQIHYYSHILPEIDINSNIINSDYKNSIIELKNSKQSEIHKGFKNLNSSQAFAFNFFQPIIDEKLFGVLLNENVTVNREDCEFEKLNKEDDTEFDFFITSGDKTYSFEVKYTEDDFGKAPCDSMHIEKWNKIYKPKIDSLIGNDKLSIEDFFDNYQIWRNILFTENPNHKTYFIYPEFRKDELDSKITNILEKYPNLKNKVSYLYVDNFVSEILNNPKYSEKLKKHYEIFKDKYLDIDFGD